jgi:hypothetical protein
MQTKTRICFFALACAAMGAQMAFAGDDRPLATVSWEEFKYRCSEAKDKPLNQQGKPEHIRLQCTNVERDFVAAEPGFVPLQASRHVMTTVVSDKYDVAAMGRDYPASAAAKNQAPCLRYKEIERTIQVEKSLSCGEILGIKGDVNDYCAAALDMVKGTSPKLIETRDTGVTKDSCAGVNGGKDKFE